MSSLQVQRALRMAGAGALCAGELCAAVHGQQWTQPTPEELAMTSFAPAPGAPAIYLDKSVIVEDLTNETRVSIRLKVLADKGKDYANVELSYQDYYGSPYEKIAGRTIHPDGTVISFTGKPFEKLILKAGGYSEKVLVFTLPSVEVGSIVEYGFTVHQSGPPAWYLQDELYTRHAHYVWGPTIHNFYVEGKGDVPGRAAWTSILPPGTTVTRTKSVMNGLHLELDVRDVPPLATEEDMPPIKSLSYRVLFYDTPYTSISDYWKNEGDWWARNVDIFLEGKRSLNEVVAKTVNPNDATDRKARKLYAFVMTLENTDFTRQRTEREDKSQGLHKVKDVEDVLNRRRGSSDELTLLFVAMARAAGLKAYVMGVADREKRIWTNEYMSMQQMDDLIAIVVIDGKDVYFDPGQRYCEPEHLAWTHMLTGGLRQTEHGTEIAQTPEESYKSAHVSRVADLKIDDTGSAEGVVTLSFMGAPALGWRQRALLGDEASVKTDLRKELESALPSGMDVEALNVENLSDDEKPLKASFKVKGVVGSATGKRLLIPADCFEAGAKPRFTPSNRTVAVDLQYAVYRQDAVRYSFAPGLILESSPEAEKKVVPELAVYGFRTEPGRNSVTSFRELGIGTAFILPKEYPEFHSFYTTIQTKDQEMVVLTRSPTAAIDASKKPGS